MASGGEQTGTEIPTDIARLPVGEALRTRREQLGWGLPEVAAWLRIRLPYLEALEGGQAAKLPGGAYAMGFLRAYATALGLDADDMVRRFRGETKEVNRKPELSFPVPVPERGVPAGAIVLLGVVMVVAAYVGWFELGGRSAHEAHTVPPVPDALAPYAGGNGRGPSPQVATVMPGPGQTPSAVPPGGSDPRPSSGEAQKPVGSTPETAGVAADMPPVQSTVQNTTPVPVQTPVSSAAGAPVAGTPATAPAGTNPAVPQGAQPAAAATASVAASDAGQVTLNAVSNCWVQVRQPGGKVIYDHVLQAGEHWSVPADAGEVVLNTGNAGGLTVTAGGVTSAVLGRVGAVRRGVPLTVEAVKSGAIVADTAAKPASSGAPVVASPGVPGAAPAAAVPADGSTATPVPTVPPRTVARPHRATPAAQGEDETERLNRAQLKQPAPPQ